MDTFHNVAFAAASSVRTGNTAFDMILTTMICCFLPSVISHSKDILLKCLDYIKGRVVTKEHQFATTWKIKRTKSSNSHEGYHNDTLISCVEVYITKHHEDWLKNEPHVNCNFAHKRASLERQDASTTFGSIFQYLVVACRPLDNQFVMIRKNLYLQISTVNENEVNEETGKEYQKRDEVFTFASDLPPPHGREVIRDFIEEVKQEYYKILFTKAETKHYFYTLVHWPKYQPSDVDGKVKAMPLPLYNQFNLEFHKQFSSLFFEEKKRVIDLLDSFTNKTNQFRISGSPRRLGILLHGPPGTGKTSLIKAIAAHTKRHVISLQLQRIQTNEQLLQLLHNVEFVTTGDGSVYRTLSTKLPQDKVIFVLEDIDACGKKNLLAKRKTDDSDDSDDDKNNNINDEGCERVHPRMKFSSDKIDDLDRSDDLNLSGILNAIDGVVESSGRIIIVTSNHPEKLDPAFLRPGRIDLKLLLTYIKPQSFCDIVSHFMEIELTPEQKQRIFDYFVNHPNAQITPATCEGECLSGHTVDEIIDRMPQMDEQLTTTTTTNKINE